MRVAVPTEGSNTVEENDILLSDNETAALIGVSRCWVNQLRKSGRLTFETRPTASETSKAVRYGYRLSAVLAFMVSRGATKTELVNAKRHALTVRRLKLARAADKARGTAVYHARCAHTARVAAAEAGHEPSIKELEGTVRP